MNEFIDIIKLKLSWPKKIALAALVALLALCSTLTMALVLDSNAFQSLKQAKVIDKLLAMTPASQISVPAFALALLFLAAFSGAVFYRLYLKQKKLLHEVTIFISETLTSVVEQTQIPMEIKFQKGTIKLSPKEK